MFLLQFVISLRLDRGKDKWGPGGVEGEGALQEPGPGHQLSTPGAILYSSR